MEEDERTVNHIAVELEAGVVEDKVNSTAIQTPNEIPKLLDVVTENVLLSRSESVTAGRLELLDVLLGHLRERKNERPVERRHVGEQGE